MVTTQKSWPRCNQNSLSSSKELDHSGATTAHSRIRLQLQLLLWRVRRKANCYCCHCFCSSCQSNTCGSLLPSHNISISANTATFETTGSLLLLSFVAGSAAQTGLFAKTLVCFSAHFRRMN